MADSQAWQTQFSDQPWFDHPTSSHGIQPQPLQPEIDLIIMPNGSGSGSDPQTRTGQAGADPTWSLFELRANPPINAAVAVNVTENLGRVKRIRKSHKCDSQRFTVFGDTKHARPTGKCIASDTEPIMVSQDVIENLKNLAYKDMVLMVTTLYQFFVVQLISEETDNLKRWKTTQEGQTFVSRLKGAVKNIHSEFQKAARIVVLASNQSLAELLMTNAVDMQASQDARVGNLVENASSFDVPIQVPVENGGHVGSFQVPLAHPSVTALLEYVLVDKKYSDYLCMETGNWKTWFEHAFAFLAAICHRELQRLPHAGWVNAAANDFPINGVEVAYNGI
ncbi:hypothetical protein BDR07DRAFT_1379337 [Suillus spraguei]|nr:hypothetical protein BDR07DRAFT_1379337 [Suillus spraguei]